MNVFYTSVARVRAVLWLLVASLAHSRAEAGLRASQCVFFQCREEKLKRSSLRTTHGPACLSSGRRNGREMGLSLDYTGYL